MATMDREAVITTVRGCLAESLALKPAQIELTSRLIDELGADSLDFIDILFGLERQCGIKLRSAELDALLRADFAQETLVDKQFIPRADIDRLLDWLPALRAAPDLDRITPRALYSYITVESLVLLIERRLRSP
jgi:acyl carrier protein